MGFVRAAGSAVKMLKNIGARGIVLASVPLILIRAVPSWAAPTIEGSLETGGYVYSPQQYGFAGTGTEYRIYENVAFDAAFNDNWSFHFDSRAGYQSQKREAPDHWILNLYYSYLEYRSDSFGFQFGRIMDFNNLIYLYFDGCLLTNTITISGSKLILDLYGGVIVKDDYLKEYRNDLSFRTFSSVDYRNIFIKQRVGDYVAGTKVTLVAEKAGIFGLDYQLVLNNNAMAEHYASVNFETAFSTKFKLYGYGTLDLVRVLPSGTLVGMQIDPVESFSLVISHEYYRPVFLKNSYFWSYFEPYGNQEASATLLFIVSKPLTVDVKYGAIIYDSASEVGNEIALGLEHRNINKFGIKVNAELIVGPEGNLITLQAMMKRRVSILNLLAGGGVEFYNDDVITSGLSTGYFATLGADIEIIKSLILSASGEYSGNQRSRYDIRGTVSLKYIF